MNNDEYDYGHNVPRYHMDGEGDLEELTYKKTIDMKVRIKKMHPDAVIPSYAHVTDAGLDLVAVEKFYDTDMNTVYRTGIALEIPDGYVGLIFPRSSNSKKTLWLTNHVGVIDSGYRGEITFKFRSTIIEPRLRWNRIKSLFGIPSSFGIASVNEYEVGDRIGQLIIMPYPKIEFEEVDFLYPSDRGNNGYGSTGC